MRGFMSVHPAVTLCFFVAVISLTIFTMHPIMLATSLVLAVSTVAIFDKKKAIKCLFLAIPLFIIIAITNPFFVHDGITVLFYLWDKPITLEALLYGIFVATMLIAMIFWFIVVSHTMSSDKIIFLFGRVTPSIALIISMSLGLAEKAKITLHKLNETQITMGVSSSEAKPISQIRNSICTLSMLVTFLLENGVNTADSMNARGYSLPHKKCYKNYKTVRSDWVILAAIVLLFTLSLLCTPKFYYYPIIAELHTSGMAIIGYAAFVVLCSIPILLELYWKYSLKIALNINFKNERKNNVA